MKSIIPLTKRRNIAATVTLCATLPLMWGVPGVVGFALTLVSGLLLWALDASAAYHKWLSAPKRVVFVLITVGTSLASVLAHSTTGRVGFSFLCGGFIGVLSLAADGAFAKKDKPMDTTAENFTRGKLALIREATESIDECRQIINRNTQIAAEEVMRRVPGTVCDERWLSVRGDLFYFHLEPMVASVNRGQAFDFELPAELAVSADREAINRWMDSDAETQTLLKEVTPADTRPDSASVGLGRI